MHCAEMRAAFTGPATRPGPALHVHLLRPAPLVSLIHVLCLHRCGSGEGGWVAWPSRACSRSRCYLLILFCFWLPAEFWCLECEGISCKQWPQEQALFLGEKWIHISVKHAMKAKYQQPGEKVMASITKGSENNTQHIISHQAEV